MTMYPIVGSKYRPPAESILSILPLGQELELIPEPDNEHDPNAIAVWIDGSAITTTMDSSEVEALFAGHGITVFRLVSENWHLGYIPRRVAAQIHLDGPLRAKLCFGGRGGHMVEFEL